MRLRTPSARSAGLAVIVAATLLPGHAALAEQERPDRDGISFSLEGGYLNQRSTDIDSGGDFGTDRSFVRAGVRNSYSSGLGVGLGVGVGEDKYTFSGMNGIGALQPWSKIRTLRISLPLSYAPAGPWSYQVIPSLRYSYEKGADSSDGRTWSLLAGAAYRVSETLSIGPGIGVFSELEEGTSVIPILLIDWKITDRLTLETGRGFAATRGPGLQLRWRADARWTLVGGARYERSRFRLDDNGVAPRGVGEDRTVPIFVAAQYAIDDRFTLSALAGIDLAGRLRVEDAGGNVLASSNYQTTPFLALFVGLRM